MWLEFAQEFAPVTTGPGRGGTILGTCSGSQRPAPSGTPVSLYHWNEQPLVLAPDGHVLGLLKHPLNPNRRGLVRANVSNNRAQLELSYLGPNDLWTD